VTVYDKPVTRPVKAYVPVALVLTVALFPPERVIVTFAVVSPLTVPEML
jgi:hypothetical protein